MDNSLSGRLVTVFGGSGFVGKVVARALCARNARVRIAVRRPGLAGDLRLAGEVGQVHIVAADVRDPRSIAGAVEEADAVVNLVGILHQSGQSTFDSIHVGGMKAIASLAAGRGIDRCVYVSAIGADCESASAYARSKAEAEAAVFEHIRTATILRPSVVFGPGDGFFNRFAQLAQYLPVLPLIGGGMTRFQPIHVEDLAQAICVALSRPSAFGEVFELGGPTVYTFRRLMEVMLDHIGRRRFLVSVGWSVAAMMGRSMEVLTAPFPIVPMLTVDQVRLLRADNVVGSGHGMMDDLVDTPLRSVEGSLGSYLWRYRPGGQYHDRSDHSRVFPPGASSSNPAPRPSR